jgi:hypothetical protein
MGVKRYNVIPLAASLLRIAITCLHTQLGTTPVTTPGVPLDGVIRTHTDPLRQRPVLALLLSKRPLGDKCLLRRL